MLCITDSLSTKDQKGQSLQLSISPEPCFVNQNRYIVHIQVRPLIPRADLEHPSLTFNIKYAPEWPSLDLSLDIKVVYILIDHHLFW